MSDRLCQRTEGPCPYGPRKWLGRRYKPEEATPPSRYVDDVCQAEWEAASDA